MKNFSRPLLPLLLLAGWGLTPTPSLGSEARVDSAGGLTTIMSDETTDLDLFLDGNPAGLALLKHQDRFDLSGQWFYSNAQPAGVGSVQQSFATVPRFSDDGLLRYGGLMVFPEPQWAFQLGGDFLDSQGQAVYTNDTFSTQQYRSLLRVAFDPGPIALGLEFLNIQTDKHFDQGIYEPPGVNGPYFGINGGSSGQNQTLLKGGFVTKFPENAAEDEPHWQVGGYSSIQLATATEVQTLNLFTLGSNPFDITPTTNLADNYSFVPEIRYEVPNRFILKFSYIMTYWDQDFSQDIPAGTPILSTLRKFRATQFQSMDANGEFKVMEPVSDKETLKIGGSLVSIFNNINQLNTNQFLYNNENKQQINASLGVGLESIYDYLFGIQFKTQNYINNTQATSFTAGTVSADYDAYQLAIGGEKWLSSNWAFRIGLMLEDDVYSQSGGLQNLNTTIVGGVGYESLFWKADLKLQAGQTVDVNDTTNLSTQTGAELSGTLFL